MNFECSPREVRQILNTGLCPCSPYRTQPRSRLRRRWYKKDDDSKILPSSITIILEQSLSKERNRDRICNLEVWYLEKQRRSVKNTALVYTLLDTLSSKSNFVFKNNSFHQIMTEKMRNGVSEQLLLLLGGQQLCGNLVQSIIKMFKLNCCCS